jgi:lipopolysaccharide transport system permease protein
MRSPTLAREVPVTPLESGRPVGGQRTVIRPRQGWQAVDLGELWRARELLWIFTLREIQVRYKQSFFGIAWAVIVPVVQVLVFTVFFGNLLDVSGRVNAAAGMELPYPLFVLTGLIVWNFFKTTVDGASNSLLSHAHIIRKIYVPRLVLPLAAVGKPALDTAATFLLMLGLLAWYAGAAGLSWHLLLAPLLLAGTALPALALGLIVAAITVSYRDLQYVLPFFTQTLFFVSAVIYSVDVLPADVAWLMYLNPVVGFVEAHRAAVMGLAIDWQGLGVSAAVALALFITGLFYFVRAEREFADVA